MSGLIGYKMAPGTQTLALYLPVATYTDKTRRMEIVILAMLTRLPRIY